MLRSILAALIFVAVVATMACGGSSGEDSSSTSLPDRTDIPTVAVRVSPESRPTTVPLEATPVVQTSTLGEITRQANETPQSTELRELQSAICADDVLVIKTSLENVYAALTCDKFDNEQFAQFFAGKQVALVLEVTTGRYRILIQALDGTSAEITPDSIWVA